MKEFVLSLLRHWGAAAIFIGGVITNALITKIIESNDLEWLKAIWTAIVGCFAWLYNGFLSSVSVPVWLLLPMVGLALIPVWQLAKRVRLAAKEAPEELRLTRQQDMVLRTVQLMDQVRRYDANVAGVVERTTLSPLEVDAAFDVLVDLALITRTRSMYGGHGYAVLPAGRAYLLQNRDPNAAAV